MRRPAGFAVPRRGGDRTTRPHPREGAGRTAENRRTREDPILFIIFGTRGITSTQEDGDFHCPRCDAGRRYDHKRVRRFFTLYFIPLIPLNVVGEYVECRACEGTFAPEVLEFSPEAPREKFEAAFAGAVRHVLVRMALADRRVTPEETDTVREAYQQITGDAIGAEEIDAEIERTRAEAGGLAEYLGQVAYRLNDHGKEMVLHAAFAVAAADNVFGDEERRLLQRIGEALEMTPSHVRGTLASIPAAD